MILYNYIFFHFFLDKQNIKNARDTSQISNYSIETYNLQDSNSIVKIDKASVNKNGKIFYVLSFILCQLLSKKMDQF